MMAPMMSSLRPRSCDSHERHLSSGGAEPTAEQKTAGLMADMPNEEEGRVDKGELASTCSMVGGDQDWLRLGIGVGRLSSDREHPSKLHPWSSNSNSDKGDAIAPPPMAIAGLQKSAPVFPVATGGFSHLWLAPDQNPSSSSTFSRSFRLQRPMMASLISSSVGLDRGMRVISRPRRPQTGLWLVLQEARDQAKKPYWRQIPKCYLKIKDGRMSIRLLMKYLSNKLGLEDESHVEITCRGQQLPPSLTLIYVRDNIWCLPETVVMQSDSSSTKYVMTLLYRCRNK